MPESNRTTTPSPNRSKRTKRVINTLVLGGCFLFGCQHAFGAQTIDSFTFAFRSPMTNTGVDANAAGNVRGNITRRGATDHQSLKFILSNLDTNATYHLVAFLGDSTTPVAVTDFLTDRHGRSSAVYIKGSPVAAHALPGAIDPLSNVRELDVVDGSGATILQTDVTAAHAFLYSVKRAMENTGFLPAAVGSLRLSGSPRVTRLSIAASTLTPLTSYQVLVNGVSVATKTSDRRGKLNVSGPRTGMPLVLDIRTVSLADANNNIILQSTGLGIPGVITTTGQSGVAVGAAASFGVLAGSTVTSVNATTVNGDVGVSPGTAVVGFPPGTVSNGAIHAGDTTAAAAEADLTTAYNDAKGRTLAPVTVAGNLGGQTLTPGLYKSTGSLEVSSGDLTLDAQGDANGVWIFQIASTLTTTAGRQVILAGGAKASNVFWQVGTSATLGTTTVFKGTIMADQAITLDTGGSLEGRALARIAAVSLDGNAITVPAP